MALFGRRREDDLQWLEDGLLAAEEDEFDEDWDEESEDEDWDEESGEDDWDEDEDYDDGELTPGYNYAVDAARALYTDAIYSEPEAVLADKKRKKKKKKRSDIRGLKFLATLELLGILGIIGWWIVWLN